MRKCFAILLLLLLLFNIAGYRVLFSSLQHRAQLQMEAWLDGKPLNTAGLFVIKVPLYLPYITGTASFERYNGSIEVNGFFYNYVAKAITNDTLVLVCMPNNLQTRLSNATKEYAGIISTIQNKSTQNSNSAVLLLKLLKAEYNQEPVPYPSYIASIVTGLNKVCDDNTVCDVLISSPDEPPEIAQRYSNFYC